MPWIKVVYLGLATIDNNLVLQQFNHTLIAVSPAEKCELPDDISGLVGIFICE